MDGYEQVLKGIKVSDGLSIIYRIVCGNDEVCNLLTFI